MHMSQWNIASFSKEDQDKVSVDKAAAAEVIIIGSVSREENLCVCL